MDWHRFTKRAYVALAVAMLLFAGSAYLYNFVTGKSYGIPSSSPYGAPRR